MIPIAADGQCLAQSVFDAIVQAHMQCGLDGSRTAKESPRTAWPFPVCHGDVLLLLHG
jgi:hypothetical protein